jgi:hypothetical protein
VERAVMIGKLVFWRVLSDKDFAFAISSQYCMKRISKAIKSNRSQSILIIKTLAKRASLCYANYISVEPSLNRAIRPMNPTPSNQVVLQKF